MLSLRFNMITSETYAAAPVMRHRLGDVALETTGYGETLRIGDASVSFHPAGHVPGSAQIRIEVHGEVWVASGDYKTVDDGLALGQILAGLERDQDKGEAECGLGRYMHRCVDRIG